jgi:hypothetical protein
MCVGYVKMREELKKNNNNNIIINWSVKFDVVAV